VGNPFFFQPRPGRNEKVFRIIKFRSMSNKRDGNGVLLHDDLRLTKIGKFMRRTSLDELPQLVNVFKGEMSFVGPRPLRVRYLPFYKNEEKVRHLVRPGITGLAQISGRNAITWDERLQKDIEYVHNMNFLLDIKILFKTVFKLFKTSETYFTTESDNLDEHREELII
jgi:lipopolysaccharide/colanic/teichoic acid biosynthesis glycosyltransferase